MSRVEMDVEAAETDRHGQPVAGERKLNSNPELEGGPVRFETNNQQEKEVQDSLDLDDFSVLTAFERASYQYSCHKKSIRKPSSLNRVKRRLVDKFGQSRGLKLVPPSYRDHEKIAARDLKGDLFEILSNECTEQLYDDNPHGKFGTVGLLSFARLHHINLHYLEVELAAEQVDIVNKKTTDRRQILRIRKKLRDYASAIADYERVLNHWHQPSRGKLTSFHESILPEQFKNLIKRDERFAWDNAYIPLSSSNPWAAGIMSRVGAALFGGLAVLVPMLIMAVHDASAKNLIVTSVAVALVSLTLGTVSVGSWKDILGITAAYAAIFVVFIGTSTPTSSA